ncbi:MAG: hydrogenase expression/formation protein [Thiobacillaceae bacterium]|jgi:hydrogenase-1 operon protein HyaF|nr:hydrogenase expression/formation protein [Thiobacillaceae bacterium]
MTLERIPIRVEADDLPMSGNAPAVLREIGELLHRLAEEGVGGAIDLRSLPFLPGDRVWLEERLGCGEVEISLQAGGLSTFSETRFPGVWWVVHRNPQGAVVSEQVEVTRVPDIIVADPNDVRNGLANLNDLISGLS